MDKTEKHVMAWVPSMWEDAIKSKEWDSLCEALYGALQACNQADALEDYEAYQILAKVARERRIDAIRSKYKEAA